MIIRIKLRKLNNLADIVFRECIKINEIDVNGSMGGTYENKNEYF